MKKFIITLTTVVSFVLFIGGGSVEAISPSQWKAGKIIDDHLFIKEDAFSASQIDTLLDQEIPECDNDGSESVTYEWPENSGSYVTTSRATYGERKGNPAPFTCLDEYYENPTTKKNNYGDKPVPEGAKSAGQIIYDAGQEYGINPQVLVVMLKKESSVYRDDWPFESQYLYAMGYACPDVDMDGDGEPDCDPDKAGFSVQIYNAARRLKDIYTNSDKSWWTHKKAYATNSIRWNTWNNGDAHYTNSSNKMVPCGSKDIYIANRATAALYTYTPYQPNQASLNAYPAAVRSDRTGGAGTGSFNYECASYGNRNFWYMFNDMFGSTSGSPLFQINGRGTYYLEWGDYYYPIHSESALYAYGLQNMAPRDLSDTPNKTKGPALSRVAKFGSDNQDDPDYTALVEVVDGGRKHGVPNSTTLARHGYSTYTTYPSDLATVLSKGDSLRPVVRKPNGAIYLMESNKKRGFPDGETYSTLSGANYKNVEEVYSKQQLTNMSSRYIDSKEDGAPMLLDGKFISSKDTPAIYLYENGAARLFSAGSYSSWGGKLDYNFNINSLNLVPKGDPVPVLVKSSSGENYIIDQGKKKRFNNTTLQEWGLVESSFENISDRSLARLQVGDTVGTLIQAVGRPGVYLVEDGERHGVPSLWDFSNLDLKWSNVQKINSNSLKLVPRGADKYAPGSLMRKPNGAVYLIDTDYTAYGVTSGSLFSRFGFSWSNVRNVNNNFFEPYDTSDNLITLVGTPDEKKYVVENGVKRAMSSAAFGPDQYAFSDDPIITLSEKALSIVDTGKDLTRYIRAEGPTVYYIENGKRRPFTTEQSFYNKGGSWSKVIDVSEEFLDEIPRGNKL